MGSGIEHLHVAAAIFDESHFKDHLQTANTNNRTWIHMKKQSFSDLHFLDLAASQLQFTNVETT